MNYKGSRSALDEHYQSIEECFEKDPPHTLAEAVARIEKLTGIKKSVKAVHEFLKRLGWKCRKVGTIPAKIDAKKQREFLNTVLRPRLEEACKGLREILFMDAATLFMVLFWAIYGRRCAFSSAHQVAERDSMYLEQ